MKITVIIPTFTSGGMEMIMSELVNHWAKSEMVVNIIFLVKHQPFYNIHKKVTTVVMPNFYYKKNIWSKLKYSIKLINYLRKNVCKQNPDIILSFGEGYNSFVLLSSIGLKKNIFVSNRSNPYKNFAWHIKKLQAILYPKATGLIAQTSTAEKILYKETQHPNISVIPNPIKRIPRVMVPKKNIILNVGRLVKEKNQITLIQIFNEICYGDWELHIIGEGPLEAVLRDEVTKLNLTSRVKFFGKKSDLSLYFSQSKIFAFTSISEGYPNALCEAMAFPLACISFDCKVGPGDIIKNEINGFLIEENNNTDYGKKLLKLMQSNELQEKFKSESIKIASSQSINEISNLYLKEFNKTIYAQ